MASYATLAEIKRYLDQITDTSKDAVLQEALDRATSIIDGFLGFSYAGYPATATAKVVSSNGTPFLTLPAHEVGSITGVASTAGGDTITSTLYAEQDDGTLYLVNAIGALGWDNRSGWGHARYTVTAKWGYGPVPEAIKQVCLEIAVNIFRGRDRGMWTDTIGAEDGGQLVFTGGLTNKQQGILKRAKHANTPLRVA